MENTKLPRLPIPRLLAPRRLAILGLACAAALAAATGGPAAAVAGEPMATAEQLKAQELSMAGPVGGSFEKVPGIGDARETETGLLEVELDDGSTITTHGADPAAELAASHYSGGGHSRRRPRCAPKGQARFHVLYTAPAGDTLRPRRVRDEIRSTVAAMNGWIHEAGRDSSGGRVSVDYRFSCTGSRRLRISTYRSSGTTASQDDFSKIVSGAMRAGHDEINEKYLIFYDDPAYYCGLGQVRDDDRHSVKNINNLGRMYSVLYGPRCWNAMPALHETAHTMGGIQGSAPHATSRWHCFDRSDVMCYDDGSSDYRSSMTPCSRQIFDCRYDDYFDARVRRGYLARHWNIGWTGNRFLQVRR